MKYREMVIETKPEMVEAILNELIAKGIYDAVIDNPLEIAEIVSSLGETEWYDAEQVTTKAHGSLPNSNGGKSSKKTDSDSDLLARITVYCTNDKEGAEKTRAIREIVKLINSRQINHTQSDLKESNNKEASDEEISSGVYIKLKESLRDDSEWKDAWKEYYHTARVSERFIVKPTWEELPEDLSLITKTFSVSGNAKGDDRTGNHKEQNDVVIIEIDPGMAFGTGTHETTSLSLRMMEKYVKSRDRVLDVGTGSGILAIAAYKLGATDVLGIDIDEDAVCVANENIQNNLPSLSELNTKVEAESETYGAGEKIFSGKDRNVRAVVGNLTERIDFTADVVVANLLADLVIKLTSSVVKHMSENAVYISSGILVEKQSQVLDCLAENGFEIIEIMEDGEWCAIAARKSL